MATITQRGPASWRVLIRCSGKKPICRTFRTEDEARLFARNQERSSTDLVTVKQAVEEYRKLRTEGRRVIKSGSNEDFMLRHLVRDLGSERPSQLTPRRLREWAGMRASAGAGAYTVDMELTKLGTVLRYAAASLNILMPDVTRGARPLLAHIGLIGAANQRDRRLLPGEEAQLLERAPAWLGEMIRFALDTAMRRGEIVRLHAKDVDHVKRLILIRDRKHPRQKLGNNQWVPLLGGSYDLIKAKPGILFPYSGERVSDTFRLVCQVAGIEGLHFHDLRHEAVSRLFEAGFTVEQAALVSGHRDWRSLKRYTHLRPESLHQSAPTHGC